MAQSQALNASPSAKVEGPGMALGERLVLHLGIGAELRYDSNVFYEGSNQTQALALRLTPAFALATKNSQRTIGPDGVPAVHTVDFRIGAGLDYREWLVSNTGVRPPRQFGVNAGFGLTLFPSGPVTAELFDNYIRTTQPPYAAINHNLDRDVNEVGIRLRIKPGGGRLELQLGYAFGIDLWEAAELQPYDNFYHHSTIRLLWKFLPKTSVYVQGDNFVYQYRHPPPNGTDPTGAVALVRPDGYPLRVVAGINGLLTSKLTFDLYAGYANGFYQNATANPNTGMAGLTLTWRPYALGTATLAYRHDFINSLLGVYADVDNVQASWAQQIWRFLAYLRLGYQNTRYKGIILLTGPTMADQTTRTDNGFALNARVDYYAYKNWIALSVGYDFNLISSDKDIPLGPMLGTISPDYKKHEVYLGVSVLY
jgi:hypothetical protein